MLDDRRHVEEHFRSVGVLHHRTVQPCPDAQRVRIGNLVSRHDPGADRAGGAEILAGGVLRRAELVVADGHVVEHGVAEDVCQRVRPGDLAFGRRSHHHRQLAFPIHLLRNLRQQDRIAIRDEDAGEFREDNRNGTHLEAGFPGVFGIVAPDADHLRRTRQRRKRRYLRRRHHGHPARPHGFSERILERRDSRRASLDEGKEVMGESRFADRGKQVGNVHRAIISHHAVAGPAIASVARKLHVSSIFVRYMFI